MCLKLLTVFMAGSIADVMNPLSGSYNPELTCATESGEIATVPLEPITVDVAWDKWLASTPVSL